MFCAYLVTCSANGKQYVGITTRSVSTRWKQHVTQRNHSKGRLARAIIRYGIAAFTVEEIACAKSLADLQILECILIEQYGTYRVGYNLTLGGEGGHGLVHTEATKAVMRARRLGTIVSQESRKKISEARTGKPLPISQVEAIRASVNIRKTTKEFTDQVRKAARVLAAKAADRRVENPKSGKYSGPVDAENVRTGTRAIRTAECRSRMRQSRLRVLSERPETKASKITGDQAALIKWFLVNSEIPQGIIGGWFGIGQTQVSNIKYGTSWPEVSPCAPMLGA